MNIFKTFILMTVLTALLMLVGGAFGGQGGMAIALGFAVVMNLGSYWFSDKIVLAMYRAREVDKESAPDLYWVVRDLAAKARLPVPRIYIMDNPTPNAFATGRNHNHAAVAVTTGIMQMLTKEELEGVLAHELSHIRHYDILIGAVAGTIVGALSSLSFMARWALIFGGGSRDDDGEGAGGIILLLLAPLIGMLLQMGISRQREYAADKGAAQITGKPKALADALAKISRGNEVVPMASGPATAHMFIMNPLSARGVFNLFSTHPPIEKRIERLMDMARNGVRM